LIRALGEETGNPIMAFHRPSFFPSVERAPHHTTTRESRVLGGFYAQSLGAVASTTGRLVWSIPQWVTFCRMTSSGLRPSQPRPLHAQLTWRGQCLISGSQD